MEQMTTSPPAEALSSPAALRNRDPILDVLRPRLPASGLVLEIAAGTGEHAVHFAAAFPGLTWQPADQDSAALASIAAWRALKALPNLLPPLTLDATQPEGWPVQRADAIVNINMIHIAPWAAALGLMRGAGRILPPGGLLYLYGPYLEADVETAPGNLAFDASLKSRDPAWGLRQLDDVKNLAAAHRLAFADRIEMPANNLSLVFQKH